MEVLMYELKQIFKRERSGGKRTASAQMVDKIDTRRECARSWTTRGTSRLRDGGKLLRGGMGVF